MIFKVFVDDSGPKEYKTPYAREFVDNPPTFDGNEQFWRENYFVLCGVRVNKDTIRSINNEINELKVSYFGTRDVEIKSVWLRNDKQRKKHYIEPFGISGEKLNEFGNAFVDLIAKHKNEMKVIAVIFDKRFYNEKRTTPDGSPLYKSTQVLFEKINRCGDDNLVIFDQMEDTLKVTKGHHKRILEIKNGNTGMAQVYTTEYSNISDVDFAQSDTENFLQVADICAYNIHRQFTVYGRDWSGEFVDEDGKTKLRTYPYFEKIICNLMCNENGQVRSFGLVCVPDIQKINWDLLNNCYVE